MPEATPELYYVYVTEIEGEPPTKVILTDEQYTAYIMSGKLPNPLPKAPEESA